MLFMAVALMVVLFVKWPQLPELTDGLGNLSPKSGPIFPCLFITIACGAISGFHATQSPLMARCMANEKQGRPLFYGAMITEGIVALIWATISSYFFYGGAAQELGVPLTLQAPEVVTTVSSGWLGMFGGALAILGVVAAPITSGDTALRSARLIIAEFLNFEQHTIRHRIYICIPLFWSRWASCGLTLPMKTASTLYGDGSDGPIRRLPCLRFGRLRCILRVSQSRIS